MRKSVNGFTLVELAVVVGVIGILASIGVVTYMSVKTDSAIKQADGIASVVRAGLERYYTKNNEYPDPATLNGGAANTAALDTISDATYSSTATTLNTNSTAIKMSQFKLIPCSATMCTSIPNSAASDNKVYYIARVANDTTDRSITTDTSCIITLSGNSTATAGATSYTIVYRNPKGSLVRYQSSNGGVAISGAGCSFN